MWMTAAISAGCFNDMKVTTTSTAATEDFAASLAKKLLPGDILAFSGGIGAGKTAFVRGLARGLGLDETLVSSPTFALVHEYTGNPTLYHFDMYRIDGEEDLYATGFYDYLDGKSILAIEWSENIADCLPQGIIDVTIETCDEQTREITVEGDARFDSDGN